MRLESAELAKISINCCLVASVTVANTLAELCENIGADWSEIAPALKLDRRIGAYSYLAPGLGIAGGNLERDLATVLRFSEEYGTEAGLIRALIGNSAHRKNWVLNALHRHLLDASPEAAIAVLGLAYKENTHSTKNSPSLALIRHLGPWKLKLHDPVVAASVVAHPEVTGAATPLGAAKGADALVIMTPWPEYRALKPTEIAAAMRGRLVLDPFRVLAPEGGAGCGTRLSHTRCKLSGAGMLKHQSETPANPERVVVIGAGGFVGSTIVDELAAAGIPTLALTRREADLLAEDGAEKLAAQLRKDDSVIFVSAVAPAKTGAQLLTNLRMAEAAQRSFAAVPPAAPRLHQLRCSLR